MTLCRIILALGAAALALFLSEKLRRCSVRALGVLAGLLTVALEGPMKLCYGRLKPVAAVYGMLLFSTVMLSGSVALACSWRDAAANLFFAGAVLFAVSDLVLSGTYFGEGRDRPVDLLLNYLTYYPGQYLIALSLLFLH